MTSPLLELPRRAFAHLDALRQRLGLGDAAAAGLRASQQAWERLARKDPLWAVLTDPRKRGGAWQSEEFFATGEREIARVFAYLAERGIEVKDTSLALDFGCGVGRLTRALAARMQEVHGVDASPTMIAEARRLAAGAPGRVTFVLNQTADLDQLASGAYAFVYSSIVLQHIPYPSSSRYVRELMRVCKPGGLVVFQVPTLDRSSLVRQIARGAARRVAQDLRLPFDGLQMEMHTIPEGEIRAAAAAAGLDVLDAVSTNSVANDSNGAIEFWREDRGERLVSKQFILRKR